MMDYGFDYKNNLSTLTFHTNANEVIPSICVQKFSLMANYQMTLVFDK